MKYKLLTVAKIKQHCSLQPFGSKTQHTPQPVTLISLLVHDHCHEKKSVTVFVDFVSNFIRMRYPQVKAGDIFRDGTNSKFQNRYMANFFLILQTLHMEKGILMDCEELRNEFCGPHCRPETCTHVTSVKCRGIHQVQARECTR